MSTWRLLGGTLLVAAFAGAALPDPVRAQALVSGSLEGSVVDSGNRPLFAVTITITDRTTGRRWIVRTNRAGVYTVDNLVAGRYDALFERLGFDPQRVEDIGVHPGERRDISVRLVTAQGPAVQTRVRAAEPSIALAAQSGPDRWMTGATTTASLPLDAGDVATAAATSSATGARFDVEGLPLGMQSVLIDGIPSAARLTPRALRARAAAFPLAAMSMAGLTTMTPDVEYNSSAGGHFAAATRPAGTSVLRGWADGAMDAFVFGADDVPAFESFRFGGLIGSAIVRDTAGVVLGGEYARTVSPYRAVWAPGGAGPALEDAAREQYGIDLTAWSRPALETAERISGFARMDLRIGARSTLNLRGLFASQPTVSWVLPAAEQPVGAALSAKATDVFAAGTLTTSVADGAASNEFNIAFELSSMERDQGSGPARDLPATTVAAAARSFGDPAGRMAESRTWSLYARNTLTIPSGAHRVKLGIAFTAPSYDLTVLHGTAGTFHFSSPGDYASGRGYYAGLAGVSTQRAWNESRFALFAQDSWKPRPDVEVLAGARLNVIKHADSIDIAPEARWLRLTGLSNQTLEQRNVEIEPRFMITWRPSETGLVVTGIAQVDAQSIDPALTSEVLVRDGSVDVRRGFGRFTGYPAVPDTVRVEGPTLSMFGPRFQGARTSRLTGAITQAIGTFSLSVAATFRRTEFLSQRKDLNLLPVAAARDQFGRPIYGQLRKEGALLFADGESNRRFPEFDEVWGLQATGTSTYRGFTITAARELAGPFGFHAAYTFSRTEDDWLLGSWGDPRSQISPFPDSLAGVDWANGRSDLDVPHRVVAGIEVQVPGRYGPRLAAVYRYQSGYPFTPGFRDGIDANADGSATNDPAFLSGTIAGTQELVGRWSCLGPLEAFAERNACRSPAIQAVDARVTIGVSSADSYAAHLVIDALNLVAPEDIVPDRAVYLVDPARSLTVSPNGRNVTVPLIANTGFGEAAARYAPQRLLRLGLRLSW